jgi:2-polyprenyl-6-methoxyphenol hydroxylase-like FAD-dependent oxidoreductase
MSYRYAGLRTWTALVNFEHERVTPAHTLIYGRGARMVFVPCGGGTVAWGATALSPEGTDPPGGPKQMLLETYDGWPAPVPEMIEATPEQAIVGRDVRDRKPADRWGEGRVTLLGDAAHPMTHFLGQGACAALEDAFILARRLNAHGTTPEALRAYEDTRIPQSRWMVTQSWRMAQNAAYKNRVACALRNGFLAVSSPAITRRLLRRAYRNLGPELKEPLAPPAAARAT